MDDDILTPSINSGFSQSAKRRLAAVGQQVSASVAPNGPIRPSAGASPIPVEQLDREVQRAQEQLLTLKRQQEQIEKQKRELEELSRRQEELDHGKAEMSEKFTRALVILDRQTTQTQKKVEQLRSTMESFTHHLRALDSIQPKMWNSNDLNKELSRALTLVEHARNEFNQSRARLFAESAVSNGGTITPEGLHGESLLPIEYEETFNGQRAHTFGYWLKAGIAFTLPLILLGIFGLFVYCWINLNLQH